MTRRFASLASLLVLATPLACVLTTDLDPDDSGTGSVDDGDENGEASVSGTDDDTGVPTDIPVDDAAATMAAARCAAFLACDCDAGLEGETWESQADCEAFLVPLLEDQVELGQGMGLQYEPECAAAYVAYYSTPGCTPPTPAIVEESAAALQCALFTGDGALGAPCEEPPGFLPGADACMPGLACIAGQCDDPHKADGAACNGAGQPRQDCEPPLYCDGTTTPPTCRPRLAIGESCENVGQCAADAWCSPDEICTVGIDPGGQCHDARSCELGVCGPQGTCIQPAQVCGPIVFEEQDACQAATDAAALFIQANMACETADDCVELDGFCYGPATCGSIAVSAAHDADAWMEIQTALEGACECGADPCGASPACVDNQCVMQLG
jgi:hypothetical protein